MYSVTGDRHLSQKNEGDKGRGKRIFLSSLGNCPSVTLKKRDRCLSPVTLRIK
jgi:hypothetical protein